MTLLQLLHASLLRAFRRSGNVGLILVAATVGLLGGLAAVLFRQMIAASQGVFFGSIQGVLGWMGGAAVIVLPAIGIAVVSWFVARWAPEARGHGVPEVMCAVKKQGGRIRARVVFVKAIASALTIGSGGSVGREGPIVHLGSTIGSVAGRWLGLRDERVKLLLACGAAAGIGGTFNAPLAGVMFSMEVILSNFAARSFGLVVVASVASTALCHAILGKAPALPLEHVFALHSGFELLVYMGLGVLMGLLALGYVQTLYRTEEIFDRWRAPSVVKAVAGGLGVGVIGYFGIRYLGGPYLFGVGYDGIEASLMLEPNTSISWSLTGEMTLLSLLLLVVLKIFATSLTLAAGGSGGVFAPALFIGGMAGGAFGMLVNALFPGMTAPPGAYALVGMGALFGGAAHAPITAILILFEMTDNYQIILPLMIAVVISHLIASSIRMDSVYTIKVRRSGAMKPEGKFCSVLDLILVADAMVADHPTVGPDEPIETLATALHRGHHRGFPVVTSSGELIGIVTVYDVERAVMSEDSDRIVARDIMTRNLITCAPSERLRDVLERVTTQDVGQLPVVSSSDPSRLLGVLRREQVFWAYGELAAEHRRLVEHSGPDPIAAESDSVEISFQVTQADAQLCFHKIREIEIPADCLIALLRRADQVIIPHGNTVVEPGDVLSIMTTQGRREAIHAWLISAR